MAIYAELLELLEQRGDAQYGESLSVRDHLLLAAQGARRAGLAAHLVGAALLHDVGHLLDAPDDWSGVHGHAATGAAWVAERLGPEVARPVGLHVEAKRYLCGVEPPYLARLSAASRHSLSKQGGALGAAEQRAFEATPGSQDAVILRRLEDGLGKTACAPPELATFRALLGELA